jgi:hypothetical protein
LVVLALSAIVFLLPACNANVGAQPPPQEPTSEVQPGFKPGNPTPTRNTQPRPTLAPGDPNQPVSNQTPVTPAKQNTSQTKITGRVTNTAGEPIARARLAFSDSSVPMPEIAYTTNANGEYNMNVPRGTYTLAVYADGYASQERKLDTRAEAQAQIDFVLSPQ